MRPSNADSEATHAAVLAALREALDAGVEPRQISMRVIASRAGVSVATVQYYFGSRGELLEAALDGLYDRVRSAADELLAEVSALEPEPVASRAFIARAARRFYRLLVTERPLVLLRQITNAERGELHPRRRIQFQGFIVNAAVEALRPHALVSDARIRLSVHTLSAAITRFAMMTDPELEVVTGTTGEEARLAIEAHLEEVALSLLRGPPVHDKEGARG